MSEPTTYTPPDPMALYRARRGHTEARGQIACEGCGAPSAYYDPEENIGLCVTCCETADISDEEGAEA